MTKGIQNSKKYLQAPSINEIEEFMKEFNIKKYTTLEHFYGIPKGTMKQIKFGNRSLPARFWHIIYEKIKPAYGAGFLQKDGEVSLSPPINRDEIMKKIFNKQVTKKVTEIPEATEITVISDKLANLLGS